MKNKILLVLIYTILTTSCFGMRIMHPHLIRAALSNAITLPITAIVTSSKNSQNPPNSKKAIKIITTASVVALVGLTATGLDTIDSITK